MKQQWLGTAVALMLCFFVPLASAQQRGKGNERQGKGGESNKGGKNEGKNEGRGEPHKTGEKPNENKSAGKAPGGNWSEDKKSPGRESATNHNQVHQPNHGEGAAAKNASEKNQQPSGKEGAAAGAAAANRNRPNSTGAEGAAAGAAAAKRNKPNATGAEGAAAGAAAANRNKPNATGAEGAAVGAAAANRNKPAASGAEGLAVGAAAANHNRADIHGAAGAAAGYDAVRNSFDHPSLYNQQWHAEHPDAWHANNWPAGAVWTATSLAAVSTHCGYTNSTPINYGYGSNIVCQDGNVILDGQNVGSAEEFSQQAADLAQVGQNAESKSTDEWIPLGVFALVRNEDQHAQLTLQLAINQDGILQGNYTDTVSDHALPIHGAVDRQNQRAAWTVNNNKNFFMEVGLSNLTTGEAPTLIHKYGRTEKWLLIRLEKPESVASSN